MKLSYHWLQSYLPEIPIPETLWNIFTFHLCEVESIEKLPNGDTVFDINILPNRAHDLLSHQGVAQELAALLDIEYKSPEELYTIPTSKSTSLSIEIHSPFCRRYMGRIIRNVKISPSPEWVKKYLESIGQKSINNIVDASNIVMFDCGNPTHIFDANKISDRKITIKEIKETHNIELLGGVEVSLKAPDVVICDSEDTIVALAGIKGGKNAEVDAGTVDLLLEVANFDPIATRKTGRRLGLFTDALKRFENDLSPTRAEFAMKALSALIMEMCPDAEFEEIVDVFPERMQWEKIRTVEVSVAYINEKLGSDFSEDDIADVWKRLKFNYKKNQTLFVIQIPLLRLDIVDTSDLIEEVGRVIGYHTLLPQLPRIDFIPKVNEVAYQIVAAKRKLTDDGYKEVMTYTFTKKGIRHVIQGAKGKEALRTNLTDALQDAYTLNKLHAPLLGESEIKIFEIGTVFLDNEIEELHVAWMDKNETREMSLKEFTKDIAVSTSNDYMYVSEAKKINTFTPWSVFPFIVRDISLWLPEYMSVAQVTEMLEKMKEGLIVRGPDIIDTFQKEGKISVAFRFVFQSTERTLTDEEVEKIMENMTKELVAHGCEIR